MMKLILLLLACFGFTRAQVPDTCPKPPLNLLCLLGPRNTCTNDSNCEPGTLCCFDGCRRRCRDPSIFSGGAREAKPRPGACRKLSPPSEFCPSDFDECQFDWDCTDSTKKCCSNNCYKVCAEPGVGTVQDSCPAPSKLLRCHFGLGNQCVNHSECSYLKNGLCCFDGCRRRCATPLGFEARIQTERPGKCPILPYPEFCVSHADECEFDGDCFPGKKCCSNDCFSRCVDPLDPPNSDLGQIGMISGAAAGKCPVPSTTNRCHIGLTHTCNKDEECPADLYCCFDGCRRTCFDPVKNSSSAVQGVKSGTCPGLPAPELCASDIDECFLDSDCFGNRKCCSNGCYKLCAPPSEGAVAAAVKCPEPVVHHCSHSLDHLCDDTDECTGGMICCFDGCRRRCVPPKGTPDTCPREPQNLLCFVGLRNTCVDDNSCKPGTLCCKDGCRKRCRDPSNFNRGAREAKPRPGVCPILTLPSEFCPSDFDECQFDWDCEGSTKKCCSNTCYRVCAEPGVGADQDPCPAPRGSSKCHMGLRNLCLNNSQCGHVENGICCFDGCRRRCATPKGFEARLQTERPGRCPVLLEPEFCVSHADECEFDGDCYPGKKCCSNNCFKSCVDPELGLIGSTSNRRCPIPSNTTRCHIGLVHTCNVDKECPTETYCCFDGCRRKCLDPDDRNKARPGGEQKNGLCPALPAPEFCASDMDECFIDWDCVDDWKCCSNGCFKVCVSPDEGGVAAAVKCPEPVVHHCSRSLKHLCDDSDDCSGKTVCCFDGCRRRCIDSIGEAGFHEGITVSCRKDEMQIDVERGVLNGFKSVFLRLNDRSCVAEGNETHFTLKAPLMGCGTFSKHTEDSVVYSNEVQEEDVTLEHVITRMPELSIPFNCFYTKEGVTSTFGLIPNKVRMTMDGGDTTTEFVLEMAVFRDQRFQIPFGSGDFPLKVSLSKPLYIQLSVDSSDTRLTIREQRCYATPTQNPKDKMQYDIIRDGCVVDSTVTYYPAPPGLRRFSFETFQFTGQNGNFVYLHCDLLVCNASNPFSRCSIGCLSYPRKRRDLEEPGVTRAALTEGPFLLRGKDQAKSRSEEVSSINVNTWVVIAMAAFCALCLAIIVYMKVKTSPKPKPDPDRETYI